MARITIGAVFHVDDADADAVIAALKEQFDIQLVHVQQSYGKLWIMKGGQQ